jgi:hypothetical protein
MAVALYQQSLAKEKERELREAAAGGGRPGKNAIDYLLSSRFQKALFVIQATAASGNHSAGGRPSVASASVRGLLRTPAYTMLSSICKCVQMASLLR